MSLYTRGNIDIQHDMGKHSYKQVFIGIIFKRFENNINRLRGSLTRKWQKAFFLLVQISHPYVVWNNFPKFQENRSSSFWDMRQSMCVIVVGGYHYRGRAGGVIRSEKLENQKNSPNTKIKFLILM